MGYWEVSQLARDSDFQSRIAACYGTETLAQDPESWSVLHQWQIASAPGFGDAYTYAINSGNPAPGKDPSVITDAQILAAVQFILSEGEDTAAPDEPVILEEMILPDDDLVEGETDHG